MSMIQMVDLQTQYSRLKTQIDTEIESVLFSGTYINGPVVSGFENQLAAFTGSEYVISCGNGTDALMIAFMALDLPPGSEVITPAFSYAAVAETLHLLGLKPVYAEVNPQTFLLDSAEIERLITTRTKAIVPVHLYGQCCDMEAIMALAEKYRLYVIEDNAQAIGAEYTFSNGSKKQAGTIAHIGTTSFFPTKNLGCYGDGGAVFTQDATLAKRIRMIANHGQEKKYQHELVGINSRLDALQAAILTVKLKYLKEFAESRQKAAAEYDKGLGDLQGIEIPVRSSNSSHVFHQYTLKVESNAKRDALKEFLASRKIPSMVYYPKPLYRQKAYEQTLAMYNTEDLCGRVLSLPMHTELTQEQISTIIQSIKEFYQL